MLCTLVNWFKGALDADNHSTAFAFYAASAASSYNPRGKKKKKKRTNEAGDAAVVRRCTSPRRPEMRNEHLNQW